MYKRYNDYLKETDKNLINFYEEWEHLKHIIITYNDGIPTKKLQDKVDAITSWMFKQEIIVSYNGKLGSYKEKTESFNLYEDDAVTLRSIMQRLYVGVALLELPLLISDTNVSCSSNSIRISVAQLEDEKAKHILHNVKSYERKYFIDQVLDDLNHV